MESNNDSKIALVYGGCGALGKTFISKLKSENYYAISVDLLPNPEADFNVKVTELSDWSKQSGEVIGQVERSKLTSSDQKLDLITCVAGGWAGGNAADDNLVISCDSMWKQSVWSSLICAQIAAKFLNPNGGLLQLTGAVPSLGGTPGMLGYGMAKAAVHQLTKSLAEPKSGLPEGATVLAILPVTLDTPMNRKFMPDADFSSWTKLDFVVEKVLEWKGNSLMDRPKNGSLVKFVTSNNETELTTE